MNKKLLVQHGIIAVTLGSVLWLYAWLDRGCFFRILTGIPCPTCGVSRSLLATLHLDFQGVWTYHPLALPIVLGFLLGLHSNPLEKYRRWIFAYLLIIGITTFLFYLYRLSKGLIP